MACIGLSKHVQHVSIVHHPHIMEYPHSSQLFSKVGHSKNTRLVSYSHLGYLLEI